jgi:hypothetical protein
MLALRNWMDSVFLTRLQTKMLVKAAAAAAIVATASGFTISPSALPSTKRAASCVSL